LLVLFNSIEFHLPLNSGQILRFARSPVLISICTEGTNVIVSIK